MFPHQGFTSFILNCSFPCKQALTAPAIHSWFQALLLILIGITAFSLVSALATIRRNGAVSGRLFRLTNRQSRWAVSAAGNPAAPVGPGLAAFGVLLNGCPPVDSAGSPPSAASVGPTLMLNFSQDVTM
jgi:hypothetical protein